MGKGLAIGYAKPGRTIGLIGRSVSRLKEVADACEKKGIPVQIQFFFSQISSGAETKIMVVNVTDKKEMERLLTEFNSEYPVDLLIANAGVQFFQYFLMLKKKSFFFPFF